MEQVTSATWIRVVGLSLEGKGYRNETPT